MDYKYSRPIRCIQDRREVPLLFDDPKIEVLGRSFRCDGTVEGLPVQVTCNREGQYRVWTERQEDLNIAYQTLVDRRLGIRRNPINPRTLAEIFGKK